MRRNREFCTGPFLLSLFGAAFCAWSALGNDINICVTAGCQLYQSVSVAGISLWWVGCGTFGLLGILALAGLVNAGRLICGAALLGDICLLLLMAVTAPCVACLVAAIFFALVYFCYLQAQNSSFGTSSLGSARNAGAGRSFLLWVWLALFTVNAGAVARSQLDVWPIIDAEDQASVRLFFSPSCPSCQKAVNALSGRVDVVFCPLAENDSDVYRIAAMHRLLDKGMSMADALRESFDAGPAGGIAGFLDGIGLRWKLLRNKAHVFSSGAQTVPFIEYRGLPASLAGHNAGRHGIATGDNGARRDSSAGLSGEKAAENARQVPAAVQLAYPGDASLPFDDPALPLISGRCTGNEPCQKTVAKPARARDRAANRPVRPPRERTPRQQASDTNPAMPANAADQ